jgi:protein involved in ribonucleotide reduction
MSSLVYFSSASDNTHRFVQKLGLDAQRIPLRPTDPFLHASEPYVLVLPTYGGGNEGGAVPKQVIRFLNDFGEAYCIAGDIIAAKCHVPYLYGFELMGTNEDVIAVREGLGRFWQRQSQIPA